jgi:hypothetical protein
MKYNTNNVCYISRWKSIACLDNCLELIQQVLDEDVNLNKKHLTSYQMGLLKMILYGLCKNKNPSAINIINKYLYVEFTVKSDRNPNIKKILRVHDLDWHSLSENPSMISFIKKHTEFIIFELLALNDNPDAINVLEENEHLWKDNYDVWTNLSMNPNAINLLEKNINMINWKFLSLNENAIHILEKNVNKIDWEFLSLNKNAIHLLKQNYDKIDWISLCQNVNAIELLEQNIEKIDWLMLSTNENAIDILEKNIDKVERYGLSCNKNPKACELYYKYCEKYNYTPRCYNGEMAENPVFIKVLENCDILYVYWDSIVKNPSALHIFAPYTE